MRKFWYLTAAVGAVLLATMTAGPAYATSAVLTSGSLGGPATVGTVKAPQKSGTNATFREPGTTTGVTCTSSGVQGDVVDNPPAPGTATLTSNFTFGNCSENISGATCVQSLGIGNSLFSTTVSSDRSVTVDGPITVQIKMCSVLGTITCTYSAASLHGIFDNWDHSITLADQRFTKVSGPTTCFSSIDFSATYAPVTDGGGALVFVNP
jgi:hypothetical protein